MNKSFLTFFASVLSLTVFGQQQNYYKMPNGKIVDSKTYESVKAKMAAYGKVEERFIAKITRNDSVIITPKLNVLTQKDDQGNYIDPYAAPKKLIGSRFPIELFKGDRSANYAKDRLKGKPSVINCWFTTCVPCIEEMPNLNALKQEFDNRVNFLAITFDDKARVNAFLKKNTFTYAMVTDAQKPLADLQIEAFPTNFILDKDGMVIDVYGDISSSEAQVKSILTELLK